MTAEPHRDLVEATLTEALALAGERPAALLEAMRYAVLGGGKRIRPLVCLAAATAVGGAAEDARWPAAAIEILHNYTLIHDDLPAMDNDTERRGRPTVWKRFGEATAILAGDALLSLACRVAAKAPRNVEAIIAALADFALNLGLAFQYEDDRLDGDGLFAPDETERRARAATDAAIAALSPLPGDTTFLRQLAERLMERKN